MGDAHYLPQSPLPEVSGAAPRRQWLADREAELLPVPYYHVVFTLPAAIGDDRLSEQGRRLRHPVQGRGRDADIDRRRPASISARSIGLTAVLAHLGLGADPPSACPRHRARRRPRRRTASAGSPAGPASSCPSGCCRGSSAGCSSKGSGGAFSRGRPRASSATSRPLADPERLRRPSRAAAPQPSGWSTPSGRSADPRPCSPISPATPTASPSPTRRLIAFDDTGVTFKWKDYRAEGRDRLKS